MYLMIENTPVLQFDNSTGIYKSLNEDLMPISLRGSFVNEDAKTEDSFSLRIKNWNTFSSFLARRVLTIDRENAKKLLNAYNLSQSQDPLTKVKIAIACKAVSMTDNYWLRDENSNEKWEDVNPRKNSLNKIVASIMLNGSSLTLTGKPHTPEFTGQGVYAKAWIRKDNNTYLCKKSTKNGNESEIEASVSKILDCFNVPHVKYEMDMYEGANVCKCENMANDALSIIPAEEVYSYCNKKEISFTAKALEIDSEMFYKTCVVDYLISNSDRHIANWGFYMNNKTGNFICCHPLFDHNNGFDKGDMEDTDGGRSQMFPNKSKKEAALYSIKKCMFKNIKPIKKDFFLSDEMYESFMKRAVELGLYKEQTPTLFQKMKIASFEKYTPVDVIEWEEDFYKKHLEKLLQKDNNNTERTKKNISLENDVENYNNHVIQHSQLQTGKTSSINEFER